MPRFEQKLDHLQRQDEGEPVRKEHDGGNRRLTFAGMVFTPRHTILDTLYVNGNSRRTGHKEHYEDNLPSSSIWRSCKV